MANLDDFEIKVVPRQTQFGEKTDDYCVSVSYKFGFKGQVTKVAKAGPLYGTWGIGDSLDDSVKKQTIIAIKECKSLRDKCEREDRQPGRLTELAKTHARYYLKGESDHANGKTGN